MSQGPEECSSNGVTDPSSTIQWTDDVYPTRPDLPPEMEGFQLCDQIGSGSTGTVFRSVQTKEYAIKVVPWYPNHLRETAKREYSIASLFSDCEKIIHVIGYYEHNSSSFILQEIGEPIIHYFFRKSCSLRTLLEALLDISDALSCIHSKGYTHFDVKPSNILVVNGRARLGDFSHCLRYVQGQEYERSMGTGAFMAPEITSGAEHSGLEDMYSLGITMYALLMAGVLPFTCEKDSDMRDQKRKQINSLFIHPALLSIIQKAASFDPAERYQTFDEFSKDIRSFMDMYDGCLDEKVPTYLQADLRALTIPPYMLTQETGLDLS